VELAELTAEEQRALAQATRPVFDRWAQQIGAALVQKAERAISARS
jgi:hypothetical protein